MYNNAKKGYSKVAINTIFNNGLGTTFPDTKMKKLYSKVAMKYNFTEKKTGGK